MVEIDGQFGLNASQLFVGRFCFGMSRKFELYVIQSVMICRMVTEHLCNRVAFSFNWMIEIMATIQHTSLRVKKQKDLSLESKK